MIYKYAGNSEDISKFIYIEKNRFYCEVRKSVIFYKITITSIFIL